MYRSFLATFCLLLCMPLAAEVDFVRDVRPIFEKHCLDCHGQQKQKSGLRLDVKAEALKGGAKNAPDIVPGKGSASPLWQRVSSHDDDERMPPNGPRLTTAEMELLKTWIDQGAVWPEGVDKVKVADKLDHWSFKPISETAPPATQGKDWARNPVDHFILERLEKEGLKPAPEAEPVSWLRRTSFDLIGLPPTPEQVQSFVESAKAGREIAMARAVDEMLKSPRHGERWAQHWLDVVRYADTHGFEVNTERPNAWHYRDYVIRAMNNDTPYDQFIREQIVGDTLGEDAATGFLITASVLLPGQIGKDEPSKRLARQDSLDEIVVNIGQSFLGLSIGCARCHDHKFDPISQRDYYAMQAFVAGVEYGDRELRTPEFEGKRAEAEGLRLHLAQVEKELSGFVPLARSGSQRPPVNAKQNIDRFPPLPAKRVHFTIHKTNNLEPCIDELECVDMKGQNVALASLGTKATSSGDIVVADRHELRHINDGRYGNSRSWMSNERGKGWVELEFQEVRTIDRVVWGRDREGKFKDRLAIDYVIEVANDDGIWQTVADSGDRAPPEDTSTANKKSKPTNFSTEGLSKDDARQATRLMEEKVVLEKQLTELENGRMAFAGIFRNPDDIHLLSRGDPEQPKEEVSPAVLSSFGSLKLSSSADEKERRKALAEWIANPKNPLTARVMVNRLWQSHFGTGLVETPSDFGHSGGKPSHPELLDWLAREFIRSGWSLKHMHKLIVLSATYRQSSTAPVQSATPDPRLLDADDRLLWHFPSHRLDAEAIRDVMLQVSGRLNTKMYGRGYDLFDKRGGLSGFQPVESYSGDGLRRMIYAHKVRREREAVFGAFDCPDAGQSTARRRESTTPIQALNLFNSRFTLDESEALAARVTREAGTDPATQIRRIYQLAFSRLPDGEELKEALPVVLQHGLPALCRAVFNSNEFLFVP